MKWFVYSVIVAVGLQTTATAAEGPFPWEIVSPLPTENGLMAVHWDGEALTAVGDRGTILRSTDCVNWTVISGVPTSKPLRGVSASPDELVAVGDDVILTSGDGEIWASQTVAPNLYAVTWSGSEFIAVGIDGNGGAIMTSDTGDTWATESTDAFLLGVACHGTTCVAVGEAGTIYTSIFGGEWMETNSGESYSLYAVAWAGNGFVAVSTNGLALKSPDGVSWTPYATGVTDTLRGVAWNGSLTVAVGHLRKGEVLTSSTGESWTKVDCGLTPKNDNVLLAVAWTGDTWVAVGGEGLILTSEDGTNWSIQSSETRSCFFSSIFVEDQFVAIASHCNVWSTYVYTSSTGENWTYRTTLGVSGTVGRDLCFGPPGYVFVGDDGGIMTSADASGWEAQTSGVSADLTGAKWCDGSYFVVGHNGTILGSANGIDWNLLNSDPGVYLRSIACGEGMIVAVGYPGVIFTSDDSGQTWHEITAPDSIQQLYDVTWGDGAFVVAANDRILYSADGLDWNAASGTYRSLFASSWNGEFFVVVGNLGTILRSGDGISWTDESPAITTQLYGAASSSRFDLAVGEDGTILLRSRAFFTDGFESGDTIEWSSTVP